MMPNVRPRAMSGAMTTDSSESARRLARCSASLALAASMSSVISGMSSGCTGTKHVPQAGILGEIGRIPREKLLGEFDPGWIDVRGGEPLQTAAGQDVDRAPV